jgi:hypothetical protein
MRKQFQNLPSPELIVPSGQEAGLSGIRPQDARAFFGRTLPWPHIPQRARDSRQPSSERIAGSRSQETALRADG